MDGTKSKFIIIQNSTGIKQFVQMSYCKGNTCVELITNLGIVKMMLSKLFNQSNSKFQPELNHLPALQLKFSLSNSKFICTRIYKAL